MRFARDEGELVTGLAGVSRGGGGGVAAVPVSIGQHARGPVAGYAHSRWKLVMGGETTNFQGFRGFYEAGQLRFGHAGLALVHEIKDTLHLPASNVLQHDDGVFAGIVHKDLLEIWRTGGKDHFVGSHR